MSLDAPKLDFVTITLCIFDAVSIESEPLSRFTFVVCRTPSPCEAR